MQDPCMQMRRIALMSVCECVHASVCYVLEHQLKQLVIRPLQEHTDTHIVHNANYTCTVERMYFRCTTPPYRSLCSSARQYISNTHTHTYGSKIQQALSLSLPVGDDQRPARELITHTSTTDHRSCNRRENRNTTHPTCVSAVSHKYHSAVVRRRVRLHLTGAV